MINEETSPEPERSEQDAPGLDDGAAPEQGLASADDRPTATGSDEKTIEWAPAADLEPPPADLDAPPSERDLSSDGQDHAAGTEPTIEVEAIETGAQSSPGRTRIELYLLRHADAGDPMAWAGPDEARPLSDKGRKQSKRLAKLLEAGGFVPDAVISSPKVRALDTAKLVAKPTKTKVRTDERLAEGVGIATVESILDDLPDARRVLLVGHDPDLSELVALLCNGQGVPLRKGSLVRIDVTRPVAPGGGDLRWLVPPDLIRAEKGGAGHAD